MKPASNITLLHVTVYRDLPSGVRNQIRWEQKASSQLQGATWHQLALHGGTAKEAFERRIPWLFRGLLLRNVYAWLVVLKLSRSYDYILLRHMPFDPFVFLFAPLISNRIGVHHSKEIEELPLIRKGLSGKLASWLERFSGKAAVRLARAILGVTPEIAAYQVALCGRQKPHFTYVNGIDISSVSLLEDKRQETPIQIAFICQTFSMWHGLDRLIDAVAKAASEAPALPAVQIHLIGNLSTAQRADIAALGEASRLFVVHGHLDAQEYRTLLAGCDCGVGSLALDLQSLRQACTLKVREMLALGLPVFSGHDDCALPEMFPFYRNAPLTLQALCDFARQMKSHSRGEVREASAPFIDKRTEMQKVVDWLRVL